MQQYLDFLRTIKEQGQVKSDRTGTGTLSCFGLEMRFDLSLGFPLVTTKKLHLKSIIHELLWFLNGDTNISYLQDSRATQELKTSPILAQLIAPQRPPEKINDK